MSLQKQNSTAHCGTKGSRFNNSVTMYTPVQCTTKDPIYKYRVLGTTNNNAYSQGSKQNKKVTGSIENVLL